MLHRPLTPFLTLLFLAACGGGAAGVGGQNFPPVTVPSISIVPANAQLTAGGAPLELTATLTGTTASIVWSLEGPGNLSSTSGTRVAYIPPGTLPTDTLATITASGGGVSGTVTITLRAARIRVAGRVIGILGSPAPGVTVSIAERSTVTDEAGRFELDEVSTPYVLTAFSLARNEAVVYQGLTRADPTILWRRPVAPVDRSAQVVGAIDGGVPVSTGGAQTLLVFSSPEAKTQASTLTPEYLLPLNWRGVATTTGSVHALQLTSPTPGALPTSFPGYGRHSEVTVFDGVTTSGVDVTLTPPAVGSVRGTFSLPPDSSFFAKFLSLRFSDGAFMSLGFDDSPRLDFTYLVPSDIGASVEITAEASAPGAIIVRRETGISPGSTDIGLALPQGAPTLSPVDGADPVDAQTEFSWGPFRGGVFTVDFAAPGQGPTFHVVTSDTRTTLPRLTALPVPTGAQYAWSVTATAPFASVDEVAGPRPFEPEGNTLLQSFSDTLGFVTR